MTFNMVVDYVKNLFPGRAPVLAAASRQSDAEAIACMALCKFYITAKNGKKYWYCVVYDRDADTIVGLLRRNGVVGQKHKSHYDCIGRRLVVRVAQDFLNKNSEAKDFVWAVMAVDTLHVENEWLNEYNAQKRMNFVEKNKQKTK